MISPFRKCITLLLHYFPQIRCGRTTRVFMEERIILRIDLLTIKALSLKTQYYHVSSVLRLTAFRKQRKKLPLCKN